MERMKIPTTEELARVVEEAAYESLKWWDSSLSAEQNQDRFDEYERQTKERKAAMGLHGELLGLSDELLLRMAPQATHQHYKGGLYRFAGEVNNLADLRIDVQYFHVFPHPRKAYTRPKSEWNEKFRLLQKPTE